MEGFSRYTSLWKHGRSHKHRSLLVTASSCFILFVVVSNLKVDYQKGKESHRWFVQSCWYGCCRHSAWRWLWHWLLAYLQCQALVLSQPRHRALRVHLVQSNSTIISLLPNLLNQV